MSPAGSSNEGRQPGTLHGDRLTPSVPGNQMVKIMNKWWRRKINNNIIKNNLTNPLQRLCHLGNDLEQWAAFFCQSTCQLETQEKWLVKSNGGVVILFFLTCLLNLNSILKHEFWSYSRDTKAMFCTFNILRGFILLEQEVITLFNDQKKKKKGTL